MSIADFEERARRPDGEKDRGARDKLLVVHVTGVEAWGSAVDAPGARRRRDAHAAEERMQRDFDAVGEFADHALGVERNDLDLRVREVFRQEATARAEAVVGI